MKTCFRIALAAFAATLASLAAPASATERHLPYAARQVAPGPGDIVRMHRYADSLGRGMPHAHVQGRIHGRHYEHARSYAWRRHGYASHRHPVWRAGYARPAYGWHRAARLAGYGRPAWHRPYGAARRPLPVYATAPRTVRSYPVADYAPYAPEAYGSYAPYAPVPGYGHGGVGYAASSMSRCGCGGGLIGAIAGY